VAQRFTLPARTRIVRSSRMSADEAPTCSFTGSASTSQPLLVLSQ
jgi:hypothetical protein